MARHCLPSARLHRDSHRVHLHCHAIRNLQGTGRKVSIEPSQSSTLEPLKKEEVLANKQQKPTLSAKPYEVLFAAQVLWQGKSTDKQSDVECKQAE